MNDVNDNSINESAGPLGQGHFVLVRLQGLSKSFGGVHALRDVTLDLAAAEIHAICGENGAGKSTLIKLLTGSLAADAGGILVYGSYGGSTAAGTQTSHDTPGQSEAWHALPTGSVTLSEAAGIAVMHQESTAFPDLNAVDNLFVGRELTKLGGLLLDHREMSRRTMEMLRRLGVSLNLNTPIGELPLAQRQMVALARALSRECRLLIMDEPTASLSSRETQTLLRIIQQLKSEGVTVLYVSHRLDEIFQIADRVTVLRDGRLVATHRIGDIDPARLIRDMVGRDLEQLSRRPRQTPLSKDPVLQVEGLCKHGIFENISFCIRAGETVGLAGLVGAGRSEIARAIFGIDSYEKGVVRVNDIPLFPGCVHRAMAAGIAMVPEDRQHEGLVLQMTVAENISLAMLNELTRCGLIRRGAEAAIVDRQIRSLDVKAASRDVKASTLSGGNQQKLVLGKWLAREPCLLILDEPTRGVDVGAKEQVHQLIRYLSSQGLATLMISSELSELLSLCDRLLVIRQGKIARELDGHDATQEELISLSLPDSGGASVPEVWGE